MNTTASSALYLKGYKEESRSADFVASSDAVDSYDEVVEQKWRLDRYLANPVVLYAHSSRELPIGRAENVRVVNGKLECSVVFASAAANPLAENVWRSIQEKTLRAVSVGFVPNEVRMEKREGRDLLVLSDNELHEISVVPIPANHEALAKMRARAARADHDGEHMNNNEKDDVVVLKAAVDEKEKALTAVRTELADTVTRLKAAEDRAGALTTERDAAAERAAKAEIALVEHELDALIGTKITPVEKPVLLELAASSRVHYDKMLTAIKARGDMALTRSVIPEDKTQPKSTAGHGNGEEFAALIDA